MLPRFLVRRVRFAERQTIQRARRLRVWPSGWFLKRPAEKLLQPGKISDQLPIPAEIAKPDYYFTKKSLLSTKEITVDCNEDPSKIEIKDAQAIARMRESCRLARQMLDLTGTLVRPGITPDEIDRKIHHEILACGAYPSPYNYDGFPKSICTSVNEIAAHGIPDDRPLQDGDIITIDISVFYNEYHGDVADTFLVGNVDEEGKRLVQATREALIAAIAVVGPNVPFRRIGEVISGVASKYNLRIVDQFVGHGIGRVFHTYPWIYHSKNDFPGEMRPGMTFTIEPILTEGKASYKKWADGWTVAMRDGGRTAQFEHTVLVTDTGVEVLTLSCTNQ